jgi:hypothetical protein
MAEEITMTGRPRQGSWRHEAGGTDVAGPMDAPPCDPGRRANAARVHRIPPRVRDDRDTPLVLGLNKTGTHRSIGGESRGVRLEGDREKYRFAWRFWFFLTSA